MQKLIFTTFLLFIAINVTSQNSGKMNKGTGVTVLTYNTHHCSPPGIGGINIDSIASVIVKLKADIVFLQEIDSNVERSGKIDEAKLVAEKANMPYFCFFKAIDLGSGKYGTAILSKYPLFENKTHYLALKKDTEQRIFGTAKIKIPKYGNIVVGTAHLDLEKEFRFIQVKQMDSIISEFTEPVIFGGDFNATPSNEEIKYLLDKYNQSAKEFVASFPNVNPDRTIDYVFCKKNKKMKFISHKVINGVNASDHLPVVTQILLF